ncbi:MAG: extracellular solute-binding protein [Acholeplasmataceae bacterium]|jgi:ABC-type glycerol-3-phosphate transport system substrate-binding protein|nr:extracellular solute-binding protein [Acholeplasmataceae bacterium]
MNFIRRNRKLTISIIVSTFVLILIVLLALNSRSVVSHPQIQKFDPVLETGNYETYLAQYNDNYENNNEEYLFSTEELILEEDEELEASYYEWRDSKTVTVEADVEKEGFYLLYFNYQSVTTSSVSLGFEVKINGSIPFIEAEQATLDTLWEEADSEVGTDRYGNDVSIRQKIVQKWRLAPLKDSGDLYPQGLKFYLGAGVNAIEFTKTSGELLLSQIIIKSLPDIPTYDEYRQLHSLIGRSYLKRYEAEETLYKNSSSTNRGISKDVGVLPFSKTKLKLNVMGTDSYNLPGEALTWKADIEEAGFYLLTFKIRVERQNTTSYRTLYINGEIPFQEATHLPFSYSGEWQNATLKNADNEPYLIYLQPGDEITLAVDSTLFVNISKKLRQIITEMSDLGLGVTKLTRNNIDENIDWDMLEYFPDLPQQLQNWHSELEEVIAVIRTLYGFERDAQIIQDIKAAIKKIDQIAEEINELPRRLGLLSTGSSSAVQLLSTQMDLILQQPLLIDAFYIHSLDSKPPRAEASFWQKAWVAIARFFLSFFDQSYREKADSNELEVWVNRSRQYVDLIQRISDDVFTKQTGIKVKVSLMSDDGKLLLANSAGQQPDVALGVSAWIPNEYGMRGMLYDLTQEEDFASVLNYYHPEQIVPMIYDNRLYGLPETENFYVLFYRKDLLKQLDLEVPETWEDVIDMLPVLERYGMSFYIPLSASGSLKSWDQTAPFIYQFGGKIYADDGFGAGVDDENTIAALNFITDLYREYSMPYQVTSFFNNFRYGTIPIGIADFGTYLQLLNTAAEIKGLWDIALVPGMTANRLNAQTGVEEEYINRSMPGAQQSGIIFAKSNKKDQAWEYLKWWVSTETQVLFAENLVNTLGSRYLWNTANLDAFGNLDWNKEHQAIILKQWESLKEVPRIPGSYMVEREISNTLNNVIFDNANLRSRISDALITMNKEINRKMKEFGYLNSEGEVIKPYYLAKSDLVRRWMDENRSED